jgi:ABC-type bacteriocin/lantibiotic exporter with double-glycine peptidase domain
MILSYHGRRTSVSTVRDRCDAGRDGVSALAIAQAARSFGLTVRGLRPTPDVLDQTTFPAIAHWRKDHFVVVERVTRRRAVVVDPGFGRRRVDRAELAEGLGDAILVCEPGPGFVRSRATEPSALRALGGALLRVPGVRWVIAQILLATVILQLIGLAVPVAMKIVVDQVFGSNGRGLVWTLGLGVAIAVLAQVVTSYLRAGLLLYLRGKLDWQVLTAFVDHLFRLPLRYFQQRTTGDIITRLQSIATLRELLTNQSVGTLLDGATVLVYLVVMFVFDPLIGLAVVAALAIQAGMYLAVRGRSRDLTGRSVNDQVRLNEYIVQSLSGVATVKAMGAEEFVVRGLVDRVFAWTGITLLRGHLTAGLETGAMAVRLVTPLLVLWLGALRAADGGLSVGTLLGLTWLAAAILAPLNGILTSIQRLQNATVQLDRLGDVLQGEPEKGGAAPPAPNPNGAMIELRDVSFRYDENNPIVLRDINVRIEPGQRVAIVGHSGAGKTTLAWLLLGLLQPSAGGIYFDGVPLARLSPRDVRRRFGVVLQESFSVRGTIAENIAFVHPEAPREEVIAAAQVADIHHQISRLPMGYETKIGERGAGLSGGQQQRLAIARAVLGRPSVLLLDEATSHLDAETELRIAANLRDLSCTLILVAHRLSTVRHADLILVLRDGVIVESGNHHELIERDGDYATLVAAQLGEPPVRDNAAACRTNTAGALASRWSAEGR